MSLNHCEKYALAQILLCGEITYEEWVDSNNFLRGVSENTIISLREEGLLSETLFDDSTTVFNDG
jgi:hypothetical protein